ncbi:hypothetical protein JR316_0012063 [Psilocybe cubensis]|uniref:Uncharacterized protein n=2 Tax=Psilocybe cubensis TaxID=181762 RepID=A0A8H7XM60_PSICU|nr:hypothetical protein JR316_0012063 [Psilocybe cubensis]KAH9474964.1 hypothetical protein JR316_0012063 [Psilocybe cubensis]
MPNPGGFQGLQKAFLLEQKPLYEKAVEQQLVSETLADISRRFLKRLPLDKPESWEPTEDELAAINDDEAEEEIPCRNPETLSPAEKEIAEKQKKERQQLLQTFRGKIKRWFRYQYKQDHKTQARNASSASSDSKNLFTLLLQQLVGKEPNRPRLKTPVNIWRKEKANRDSIEAEIEAMDPPVPVNLLVKTRDEIARRLFQELTLEEKKKWTKIASDEHSAAIAKYNADIDISGDLLTPEERQRAIEGIGPFMSPILDALCNITGWKCTFIAGGPEPANGGMLGTISVHSGVTSGDIKMNFGRAEQAKYKNIFIPIFGDFLRKCYSKSTCQEWALPQDHGQTPMFASEAFRSEEESIQAIPINESHVTAASVPKKKKKNRKKTTASPNLRQTTTPTTPPEFPVADKDVSLNSNLLNHEKGHNPFPEDWPYIMEDEDNNSGYESNNADDLSQASPTSVPPSPSLSVPPSPSLSTPPSPSLSVVHQDQQNSTTTNRTVSTATPNPTVDKVVTVSSSDATTTSPTLNPPSGLPPRANHPSVAVADPAHATSMPSTAAKNTPNTISTNTVSEPGACKTSSKRKGELKSKNPRKKRKANRLTTGTSTSASASASASAPAPATAPAPARSQRLTRSTAPTAAPAQAKLPPVPTSSVVLTRNGKPVKSSKFWVYAEDDS